MKIDVPVWEKVALTIEEAAAYSGIGQNKIRELVNLPHCPFVLYVGNKHLIKREEFVRYISSKIAI